MKKRLILICTLAAALVCMLALGINAAQTTLSTNSLDEIHSAISASEAGDGITVNLTGDMIIPKISNAIVLDKDITVTINFNGNMIVYNGNGGSAGAAYGMLVKSTGARLILNGSTKVDYLNYVEPTDEQITVSNGQIVNPNEAGTVCPDYTANGPAVVVYSGSVEFNNMYVRNHNLGEWTVYFHPVSNGGDVSNNIKATNSIIRAPKSRYAAIGTRNMSGNLTESLVEIEGCVIYGTGTTEWISMSANSYIKNSRITLNEFKIDSYLRGNHAREGKEAILQNVIFENPKLMSCTGAIYVKMIDCKFPNGMELFVTGDSQGKTVFTIIENATCESAGRQAYVEAWKNGGKTLTCFEDFPNVDADFAQANPAFGHNNQVVVKYENGLLESGYLRDGCTRCDNYVEESLLPLFECYGFSMPENGAGELAIGFKVNADAVRKYEEKTGSSISYGVFAVSQGKLGENDIFSANGEAAQGVLFAEVSKCGNDMFDLKITGFETDQQKNAELALGAYAMATKEGGKEIFYLQDKKPMNGEKYSFTSYNSETQK